MRGFKRSGQEERDRKTGNVTGAFQRRYAINVATLLKGARPRTVNEKRCGGGGAKRAPAPVCLGGSLEKGFRSSVRWAMRGSVVALIAAHVAALGTLALFLLRATPDLPHGKHGKAFSLGPVILISFFSGTTPRQLGKPNSESEPCRALLLLCFLACSAAGEVPVPRPARFLELHVKHGR